MSLFVNIYFVFFFFQEDDGIRDGHVTGVQTCALPISFIRAGRVATNCSNPAPNLKPTAAGHRFMNRPDLTRSNTLRTARLGWCAPRCAAPAADPIWATSLMTHRKHRPAIVTA